MLFPFFDLKEAIDLPVPSLFYQYFFQNGEYNCRFSFLF
ncbi:hypothetical protein TMUPMC115_2597 [Tetragenococcus muriaticus PMC-11-5]|uniref:Uncharacterized protein n=1 Tax=Tetragenococcus muriaticus PMC-11-5 TaxID=1302649 RepID=A0A091BWB4_9ENTE|nr:hypothetical protein TMUPMC115_2597 [Tetragenococcus muriaticus PMC-11-5]